MRNLASSALVAQSTRVNCALNCSCCSWVMGQARGLCAVVRSALPLASTWRPRSYSGSWVAVTEALRSTPAAVRMAPMLTPEVCCAAISVLNASEPATPTMS